MKAGVPSSLSWWELAEEGPGVSVPGLVPTEEGHQGNKAAVLAGGRGAESQGGSGCKCGGKGERRRADPFLPGPPLPTTGLNELGRTTCPTPVRAGFSANNPRKGETCSHSPNTFIFGFYARSQEAKTVLL